MKKIVFLINLILAFGMTIMFSSCKDEMEEVLVPSIDIPITSIEVGFAAGDTIVDFSSNVIVYATVDATDKSWLSYKFEDYCKTLIVQYKTNPLTEVRVGHIILSKDGVEEEITITQEANPNANGGGPAKVNLNFIVDNSSGYTILAVTADEVNKIPIGATVVLECSGNNGSISFLNPTNYSEYLGGSPVNGEFKFVWTKEIAGITAGAGITALLNNGFGVKAMYALYEKGDIQFVVDNSSGYNLLLVPAASTASIPIGALVIVECDSNEGSVSFLNPSTYAEYAGGSPQSKKIIFKWTKEIADITAGAGMMGLLNGSIKVTSIYTIYVKTELVYITDNSSGYNILAVSATEAAKIPLGATVVFESPGDAGSISLLNPTNYSQYAGGSPAKGMFSFIWTKDIIDITRNSGITALLNGGFEVSSLYCHN